VKLGLSRVLPIVVDKGFPHQGDDNSPAETVEEGRLHDHDERDGLPVFSGVPVNIELGHG